MTSLGRTYVVAGTLFVFFVLWASIAAHPWATPKPDARLAALDRRTAIVRREAAVAQQQAALRWARYRVALAARRQANARALQAAAAVPQVRVVQLPAVTTTRSS